MAILALYIGERVSRVAVGLTAGYLGKGTNVEKKTHEPERRHEIFRQLLGLFPTGSIVDLGTGHGKFAISAADHGWKVTGVDARRSRWPDDARITWVEEDVRKHDLAPYDVIACLGLFYHLNLKDQLHLLKAASGKPLIIDTSLDHGEPKSPLSDRVTVKGGYEGRYYVESSRAPTASVRNKKSFWPTLDSFHRMLRVCGYPTVLTVEPWVVSYRTFFLALPPAPAPEATDPN